MRSLDKRRERGRNRVVNARRGGRATQVKLCKATISSAHPSRRVFAFARLSLAEIRDHSQCKACWCTGFLADVIATHDNELCNVSSNGRVARILNALPLSGQPFSSFLDCSVYVSPVTFNLFLFLFAKNCLRFGPRWWRWVIGAGATGLFLLSACVLLWTHFVGQILCYS